MVIGAPMVKSLLIAAAVGAFTAVGNVTRMIAWGGYALIVIAIGASLGLLPQVNELYQLIIKVAA